MLPKRAACIVLKVNLAYLAPVLGIVVHASTLARCAPSWMLCQLTLFGLFHSFAGALVRLARQLAGEEPAMTGQHPTEGQIQRMIAADPDALATSADQLTQARPFRELLPALRIAERPALQFAAVVLPGPEG